MKRLFDVIKRCTVKKFGPKCGFLFENQVRRFFFYP